MQPSASDSEKPPALRPIGDWRDQMDISSTTAWRYAKRGWIHPITIAGKVYLSQDDIDRFEARAKTGEFACNFKTPRMKEDAA